MTIKMQKLFSQIIGTEIINAQNGKRIARVKNLIIDPKDGKVLAILINANKNLIISILDIIKWGKTIQINDPHSIIDGFEILKVEEIQEKEIEILFSIVKTEENEYIGEVYDYYVETDTANLSKILTRKRFLFVHYDERLIDFKDIKKIDKKTIIIKENFKTAKKVINKKKTPEVAPSYSI